MCEFKESSSSFETTIFKIIKNVEKDAENIQFDIIETNPVFNSVVYNVLATFNDKTKNELKRLSIILKKPTNVKDIQSVIPIHSQFHNEIVFYQKYVQPNDNFAQSFYLQEQPSCLVAMENVNKRGYYSSPDSHNASLEYVLSAMHEIGRFHGKGYVMKERKRNEFFDIVKGLHEIRYYNDNTFIQTLVNTTSMRAVNYLRNKNYDKNFCDKMEVWFSNAFENVMLETVKPREPLSTLCHGDFTVSNVLFKKQDNDRIHAILIDFGLVRYGTPVIDLSTFLCLCCSNELIERHFLDIFAVYYDGLKTYLMEAGIENIKRHYSYDALLKDYKRGALFGFAIATFYLPVLMGIFNATPDPINISHFSKSSSEAGGDEISKILADMLLLLKKLDCLKHIL